MAKIVSIKNTNELSVIQDMIHDCYFDVDDIVFDSSTEVLSFRFRRLVTSGKNWWKDFISSGRMAPAVECYLRVHHVRSYDIGDTEKVGTYDFDVLEYSPTAGQITVRTGVPIDIRIHVRDFEVSVEETDNLSRPDKTRSERSR